MTRHDQIDLPPAVAGETPQQRHERHSEFFRERQERLKALEAERKKTIPVAPDPHVIQGAMLDTAAEIARRMGRLPMTLEELTKPEAPAPTNEAIYQSMLDRRRERFERMCPPLFREAWDWSKVKPEVDRGAVEKVFGWEFGPRGLYVAGESGHSKTRALFMLLRRLVVAEKKDVVVMDGIAFSNLCTRAFGTPAETEALFRPLLLAEVLAIDDLAKRWTPATEEGAFMVLDRRTAHEKPVLVTINYTTDDLYRMQEARGDIASLRDVSTPLIRRLVDYCQAVVL